MRYAQDGKSLPLEDIPLNGAPAKKLKLAKAPSKKDPLAPKKPMTAYLLYCSVHRPALATSRPELSFGELTTELAAQWKAISDW